MNRETMNAGIKVRRIRKVILIIACISLTIALGGLCILGWPTDSRLPFDTQPITSAVAYVNLATVSICVVAIAIISVVTEFIGESIELKMLKRAKRKSCYVLKTQINADVISRGKADRRDCSVELMLRKPDGYGYVPAERIYYHCEIDYRNTEDTRVVTIDILTFYNRRHEAIFTFFDHLKPAKFTS